MDIADRPRERLLALGADRMRDAELLAVVIGSGTAARSSLELARDMLKKAGGPARLARCTPAELMDTHGVGPAVALRIVAGLQLGRRAAARSADLPGATGG